jgi:hypothetical protein
MSDDPWIDVVRRVESLAGGEATGAESKSSRSLPTAILGAALAINRFRNDGTPAEPPPQVHATPWGSVVFWWDDESRRRVEVVSAVEAWEYLVLPSGGRKSGTVFRFLFDARLDDPGI